MGLNYLVLLFRYIYTKYTTAVLDHSHTITISFRTSMEKKLLQDPLRDILDSLSPYSCVIVTVAATCGT